MYITYKLSKLIDKSLYHLIIKYLPFMFLCGIKVLKGPPRIKNCPDLTWIKNTVHVIHQLRFSFHLTVGNEHGYSYGYSIDVCIVSLLKHYYLKFREKVI